MSPSPRLSCCSHIHWLRSADYADVSPFFVTNKEVRLSSPPVGHMVLTLDSNCFSILPVYLTFLPPNPLPAPSPLPPQVSVFEDESAIFMQRKSKTTTKTRINGLIVSHWIWFDMPSGDRRKKNNTHKQRFLHTSCLMHATSYVVQVWGWQVRKSLGLGLHLYKWNHKKNTVIPLTLTCRAPQCNYSLPVLLGLVVRSGPRLPGNRRYWL